MITQEQLDTIIKVSKIIAPKYTFAHYSKEDLIQEAILMGMDAQTRWDEKRPFENFISTHISNRLKTFKRDKYYRSNGNNNITKAQESKKNLVQPERLTIDVRKPDIVGVEEFGWEELDVIVPPQLRKDYLKIRSGVKVNTCIKNKIIKLIREYVEKNW